MSRIKETEEYVIGWESTCGYSSPEQDNEKLCKIKGIGIWTASIFAMNSLNYDDIFPYGDATLMKAIKTLYGDKVYIENIISNWSPYKSFGSRVLWLWVNQGMPKI